MKDLIKKILREEVSKRYIKSSSKAESVIIKHMNNVISKTKRVIPPFEENYGSYSEEWCQGNKAILEARYHLDDETDKFFSGDLYVLESEITFLSKILEVRKSFIFNVIAEWYDDNYANKFGQEVNRPDFEIYEVHETDSPRKCYEIINTDNLSREQMIDYIDTNTLYKVSDLEGLSDDVLSRRYKSVYNIQLNK
jgi:hypothetical protein